MKEKLLYALRTIGAGGLYGLGFGFVVAVVFYVMTQQMESSMFNDRIADTVIVTKHEETKLPDSTYILGAIENRGSKPARTVRITIDFFDKQGKFIDQCHDYVHGTLNPGESRNFKLSCTCSKDKFPVEHASYKLVVTG